MPIEAHWSPKGPSLAFFPFPVIDNERPWGRSDCESCSGIECTGHYFTDLPRLLDLHRSGKAVRALPPSMIISSFIDARSPTDEISQEKLSELAKKCCLSVHDVTCWIEHLEKIAENRRRGVEKAKITRAQKKQLQQK